MTNDAGDQSEEVIFREGLAILPDGSVVIKFHGQKPIITSREDLALGAERIHELLEIAKHKNLVDEATRDTYFAVVQAISAHYERVAAIEAAITPRMK